MYMNVLHLLWILPIVGGVCFMFGAVLRLNGNDEEVGPLGGE